MREPQTNQALARRDALAAVPLLRLLGAGAIRTLDHSGTERHYSAGSMLFDEGDPGDSLHIVLKGEVKVLRVADSGKEIVVALLGPGDTLGEFSMLDDLPRSAAAVTVEGCDTLVITKANFEEWLDGDPTIARALLATLTTRLRLANELLSDMTALDLDARLRKRLAFLAEAHGSSLVRITQQALADQLGVTREATNKKLRKLQEQGLVELSRGAVRILDSRDLR